MKKRVKKKIHTLFAIAITALGISVFVLVYNFNFIFAQEGDSMVHTFQLQSLIGGTTDCFIKINLVTSDQGGIDSDNPSQFVGGGGIQPLDILSADDLDPIISYFVEIKAWCNNPPSGGQIFVDKSSIYTLHIRWVNPDGVGSTIQTSSLVQGNTFRVDDSEKTVKTLFVLASKIDDFLPEWSSTYRITPAFVVTGQMKLFETDPNSPDVARLYEINFDGTDFSPITVWDSVVVDKVTQTPDPDFADSIIFINSIVNAGTALTAQNSLDTFDDRKAVVIKGFVTDYRDTQANPRIEVFKCVSQTFCNDLHVAGREMRLLSGSSSTRQFTTTVLMPANSPDGLYMVQMSMLGRNTVDTDYFNILNINTSNTVCEVGVEICPTTAVTINTQHLIFYRNDFQDFVEGVETRANIQSGYTDESSFINTALTRAEITNPLETDDRRDRLDSISLSTVVRFQSDADFAQFKQVFFTDLSFDYLITIGGSSYNIQNKEAVIERAILTDCRTNLSSCNDKNEIFLAKATITANEIERLLKETDGGELKITAKSEGTYQIITWDGILFDGNADGATYEFVGQRGESGGTSGGQCSSSNQELCELDCTTPNVAFYNFDENKPDCRSPTKAECGITFSKDYIWDFSTQECKSNSINPFVDTDGDGIGDNVDQCPTEPETFNGFQDEDGCPDGTPPKGDGDLDGDGILDKDDVCPSQKETFNGFQDDDGCPDKLAGESDMDGDGIKDEDDVCPTIKEVVNGFEDDDGCPDSIQGENPDLKTCTNRDNNKTFTCDVFIRNQFCDGGTICSFETFGGSEPDEVITGKTGDEPTGETVNSVILACELLGISPVQCANALQAGINQAGFTSFDFRDFNDLVLFLGVGGIVTGIGIVIIKKFRR